MLAGRPGRPRAGARRRGRARRRRRARAGPLARDRAGADATQAAGRLRPRRPRRLPAGALGSARRPRPRGARRAGSRCCSPRPPRSPRGRRAAAARRRSGASAGPTRARTGAFLRALGRRYSGAYADENQGGGVLPRVSRWSFCNEPNQPSWLRPQFARRRGIAYPAAAVAYRALARAGIAGLRATGHGGDRMLLGETARSAADGAARDALRPARRVHPHAAVHRRARERRCAGAAPRVRALRAASGGCASPASRTTRTRRAARARRPTAAGRRRRSRSPRPGA